MLHHLKPDYFDFDLIIGASVSRKKKKKIIPLIIVLVVVISVILTLTFLILRKLKKNSTLKVEGE